MMMDRPGGMRWDLISKRKEVLREKKSSKFYQLLFLNLKEKVECGHFLAEYSEWEIPSEKLSCLNTTSNYIRTCIRICSFLQESACTSVWGFIHTLWICLSTNDFWRARREISETGPQKCEVSSWPPIPVSPNCINRTLQHLIGSRFSKHRVQFGRKV